MQSAEPNAGMIDRMSSRSLGSALCMLTLLLSGCGYQQMGVDNANNTPGYQWKSLYRQDIQTVAVPVFVNRTYRRGLETQLTKSVIQQLEEHSPYKVVPREKADTILECEIVAASNSTLTFGDNSGLPQDQLFTMVVSFTWKNLRTGEIIVQRRNFDQRADFVPVLGESESVGSSDAIQKLALGIVQELQADW
jgi:hypothetical protein